jgi:hypothetical protein
MSPEATPSRHSSIETAPLDLVAAVGGELQDRVARDALEDRVGLRRDDRAVLVDEDDVHAAELFDVAVLVEEDDLVAALLVRLGLRQQAGGVVAAGLRRARAALAARARSPR